MRVTGYGWCGVYADGTLGWLLSRFISGGRRNAEVLNSDQRNALKGIGGFAKGDMYRVRVTIETVKNSRGKYIVRRAAPSKRRASAR